jgi:AP-3 complex subunit sigma
MQPVDEQQRMIREIFALVSKRSDRACNFLENKGIVPGAEAQGCKFIYRHYATLYFIIVADSSESELGILDLIQVFVEALDKCFENVCELDLIFHPDRVCYILDEVVQGGMVSRPAHAPPPVPSHLSLAQVLETRQDEILSALAAMAKIEKEQDPLSKVKSVLNSVRGK